MKLDTSHLRYLSTDDFKVLTAVEIGSKGHELVPESLISQYANLKSVSAVNRSISELAKIKLICKLRNASYAGYRLTYHGYDYLALKTLSKRDSVIAVGQQIGIGKESDIFVVAGKSNNQCVLKIHRLGRISFRSVKKNRDYLKNKSPELGGNWMFLSRLAAEREYAFMSALYNEGFHVPTPIDQSRHQIVMSLVDGFPMRQLKEHENPKELYTELMNFIMKLAKHGLIHCDFNEFNIMIRNEPNQDDGSQAIVIDFPQCISISHPDAQRYFERDVDSIRQFFKRKLNFQADDYPKWSQVQREKNLDILLQASGYNKKEVNEFEKALAASREVLEDGSTFSSDEEDEEYPKQPDQYSEDADDSDESSDGDSYGSMDDDEEDDEDEYQRRVEAEIARKGIENMKTDKLGNYILDD